MEDVSRWLMLYQLSLGFERAKTCELWAAEHDPGMTAFLNITDAIRAARVNVGELLGSANAYTLLRGIVERCTPTTYAGKCYCKAVLRTWRDITVIYCARRTDVSDRRSFLRVLDEVFDGELEGNRNFTSQMLQSYHHILGALDGAFRSKSEALAARVGYVRPRAPRKRPEGRAADFVTGGMVTHLVYEDGISAGICWIFCA